MEWPQRLLQGEIATLRNMVRMWVTMQSLVLCPGTAQIVLRIRGSSLVHAHQMRPEQSPR